jgi:hypothetical protein
MSKVIRLLALALALIASPVAAQPVVKMDRQAATEGAYTAYNSPWCAYQDKSLVAGRDYINTVSFNSGDLAQAKNVQFAWRWPDAKLRKVCGVFGYNFVAWGNYDNGKYPTPVAPRQVSTISDLVFGYQVDMAGDSRLFNGLGEFYLTKVAGDADTKAIEIGWMWNAPAETIAWAATGKQLGTFKDRYGKPWTVALNHSGVAGEYVTFIPPGGKLDTGNFDGKGALDFLLAAGVISAAWWMNGAALGVEPLGNHGAAIVRNFRITWK